MNCGAPEIVCRQAASKYAARRRLTWCSDRSEGFHTSLSSLEPVAKMEALRQSWRISDLTVSVDVSLLHVEGRGAAGGQVVKIPHRVGEVELYEEVEEKSAESWVMEMT